MTASRGLPGLQPGAGGPGLRPAAAAHPGSLWRSGRAVQHSHGMTAANKLQVTVLVASGVALYASSYVPYYITAVLNVYARLRWQASAQVLRVRPRLRRHWTKGHTWPTRHRALHPSHLHPPATLHGCGCPAWTAAANAMWQDRPQRTLRAPAKPCPQRHSNPPNLRSSSPRAEPVTWPIFSPPHHKMLEPSSRMEAEGRPPGATSSPTERLPKLQEAPLTALTPGQGHRANPRWVGGGGVGPGSSPTHSVIDIRE